MSTPQDRTGVQRGEGRSLATYFIALAVTFVVIAVFAAVYVGHRAAADGRRDAAADARYAAKTAATQLGNGVTMLRDTVNGLAATPGIAKAFTMPKECQLSFAGPPGVESGHIDVISDRGAVACTSAAAGPSSKPLYASAPWFGGARERATFVTPAVDPSTGRHAMVATAPIPGGIVAGFLALESAGPDLKTLYGGGRPVEMLVVGQSPRTVIARSIDPQHSVARPLPTSALPVRDGTATDLDGRPRIYASAPVPGTSWRFYVGEDEAAALASAHALRNRQLVIIGVGSLLMLLGTWLVYRRVAMPIGRLAGDVRRAAAISPLPEIPMPHGPREIQDLGGDVNGLIGTVNDELGRRELAEHAAEQAAERYELLFARSPLPTWVADRHTGEMLHVNDAALRTYGYERDDFAALNASDIEVDAEHHRRRDGELLEVRVLEHELLEDGRAVRIVVAEDVTERHHLERQLRQQQRMEAIGRLAGGIAHDFNNLLAAIMGYSELLLARSTDPERRTEAEQIKIAADRASALTHQLLSFARGQEQQQVVFDLAELVEALRPMLRRLLPDDVELLVERGGRPPRIKASPGQIEQVIVNLVVNASHAMPHGGTVRIATRLCPAETPGEGTVTLSVRDTGIGMDADTVSKAFEPFFTTRPEGEGTGLGLATVYSIVQQSGGTIDLTSAVGDGTTFAIALPATAEPAATQDPWIAASAIDGHGDRVLLVEDDPAVRRVVTRYLVARGFQPLEAADGDAAIALSEDEQANTLGLVITDNVVPGPGGLELAARIRQRHPDVRVLIMSGYGREDVIGDDAPTPRTAFVGKPFTQDALTEKLTELLRSE